jgi:hypothetical protein
MNGGEEIARSILHTNRHFFDGATVKRRHDYAELVKGLLPAGWNIIRTPIHVWTREAL